MIVEHAPAKINLFLHVGVRRADGFHPLQSLAVFTEMGDELALAPAGEAATALRLQRALATMLPPPLRPAHLRTTAVLPTTPAGLPVRSSATTLPLCREMCAQIERPGIVRTNA